MTGESALPMALRDGRAIRVLHARRPPQIGASPRLNALGERLPQRRRPSSSRVMSPLFELPPLPPVESPETLSADRRRTMRAKASLLAGRHPLTKMPLANNGQTCGDCRSAFNVHHNTRHYWKCEKVGDTAGAATDLRKWWPACAAFEATS